MVRNMNAECAPVVKLQEVFGVSLWLKYAA